MVIEVIPEHGVRMAKNGFGLVFDQHVDRLTPNEMNQFFLETHSILTQKLGQMEAQQLGARALQMKQAGLEYVGYARIQSTTKPDVCNSSKQSNNVSANRLARLFAKREGQLGCTL